MLLFGLQTREELDEAGLIMARAYENYDYVTLYFPDMEKSRKGLLIFMRCVLKALYGKAEKKSAVPFGFFPYQGNRAKGTADFYALCT